MEQHSWLQHRYLRTALVLSTLLFGFTGTSEAQLIPDGIEFQVNTTTSLSQYEPSLAVDGNGNSLVVWTSVSQDGSSMGIFGQRFDAAGSPVGLEFQINTTTMGTQWYPKVAMNNSGDAIVVWASNYMDGESYAIAGQRYDSTGSPIGPEFQINTYTTATQSNPDVAIDDNGNIMAIWHSFGQDGDGYGIFGQRYDSTGTPLGPEFQVNTHTNSGQLHPTIAMNGNGDTVAVWSSVDQDGDSYGIFGQRYDSTGTPVGSEFQVNSYTMGGQVAASVAVDDDGNFMVAWRSPDQDGDGHGVFGQRYDSNGLPVGTEFQINSTTTDDQDIPSLSFDSEGHALVAWQSKEQDGDNWGIFAQYYDSAGAPIGNEFQVNSTTTNMQLSPAVALDPNGQAIVLWISWNQDGSDHGVFGQRYFPNHKPDCSAAKAFPPRLNSHDHAYNIISIHDVSDADGHPITITIDWISQDEAVNAPRSGNTWPDGVGIGTNAAEVRAERVDGGNGRFYHIGFTADDGLGGSCSNSVRVGVPHGKTLIDDGAKFNSTYVPPVWLKFSKEKS